MKKSAKKTTKLPGKQRRGKRAKSVYAQKHAGKLVGIHAHSEKTPPRCPACNYCHVLLSVSPTCPMCKMCAGCSNKLMHCNCREGE